jgi:uncharacterized protein involved in type VI secretion and phage assembly
MSTSDYTTSALLERQRRQFFGKYRGLVTNNRDQNQQGRLEVQVPQVLGETRVWALPAVPYAGKDVGFYAIPDAGTGVWVEFEAGDPSFPIWTGCLWGKGDIPAADADPNIKFFRTKQFRLRIDDQKGEITIERTNGSSDPTAQIVLSAMEMKLKSATIKAEGASGKSIELDAVSMRVHKSALEVI